MGQLDAPSSDVRAGRSQKVFLPKSKHGGSPGRQGGIAGERAVDEAHFAKSEQAEAEALTGRRCLSCIFFGIRASNVGGGAYP